MGDLVKLEAREEVGFLRTVAALGAVSGLVTLLLRLTAGFWTAAPLAAFLPHTVFAYALYAAVVRARGRRLRPSMELLAPLGAGVAMGLCLPSYGALGVLLFGGILGLAVPEPDTAPGPRLGVALAVAVTCLLGSFVFGALEGIAVLGTLVPQILLGAGMGAVFGGYVALGSLPGHLALASDPVRAAYERARRELTGRLLDNAARCWAMYERILRSAERSLFPDQTEFDEFQGSLRDILLTTFDLSCRWQEVEGYLARLDTTEVQARLDDTLQRAASTADPVAKGQYAKIRKSLERRLADVQTLEQAKERVMSRLDYYFTVLEDLHLSTVRLRSSTAQADQLGAASLIERMEDLSRDLKATSTTLDELGIDRMALPEGD